MKLQIRVAVVWNEIQKRKDKTKDKIKEKNVEMMKTKEYREEADV